MELKSKFILVPKKKKKIEIDAEFFHHPIFHELFEDPLHLIGWPDWEVAGSWT